jgi:gas vesicle protein
MADERHTSRVLLDLLLASAGEHELMPGSPLSESLSTALRQLQRSARAMESRRVVEGGGFMIGLLTGTVLGAALGVFLAPRAGSQLRGAIGEQARNLASRASEQYRRASEEAVGWAERGREFIDREREEVARGAEEARWRSSGLAGDPIPPNPKTRE